MNSQLRAKAVMNCIEADTGLTVSDMLSDMAIDSTRSFKEASDDKGKRKNYKGLALGLLAKSYRNESDQKYKRACSSLLDSGHNDGLEGSIKNPKELRRARYEKRQKMLDALKQEAHKRGGFLRYVKSKFFDRPLTKMELRRLNRGMKNISKEMRRNARENNVVVTALPGLKNLTSMERDQLSEVGGIRSVISGGLSSPVDLSASESESTDSDDEYELEAKGKTNINEISEEGLNDVLAMLQLNRTPDVPTE